MNNTSRRFNQLPLRYDWLTEHLAVVDALGQRCSAKAVTAIHAHITSAKRWAFGM